MSDPLIQKIRKNKRFLELLGKAWGIFYFEGHGPDIGIRRQNFLRIAFEEELGLKIREAPSLERQVDFYIKINESDLPYSVKTTEDIGTLKVAWNSYPDVERLKEAARKFSFRSPILYVYKDGICVFEADDIENLRRRLGFDDFWSIPRREVNPRGFGINGRAIRELVEMAKKKGNFVKITSVRMEDEEVRKEYFRRWYRFIKNFIKDLDELA